MGHKTVLAVFALSLVATQAAPAAPSSSFFPLAAGNRWTLHDLERGSSATVAVSATRSPGFVLRGFPGTADLRVRAVGPDDRGVGPRQRPLGAVPPAGRSRPARSTPSISRSAPLWRSVVVTVASRQAVVEDARDKTLRGCVRLTIRPPKNVRDAGIEELVFAPGIGLVRVSEITIAGVRERVLESYKL